MVSLRGNEPVSAFGQENCARFARAEARECSNLRQAHPCRLFPVFFLPLTCVAPVFVGYARSVDDLILPVEKMVFIIGKMKKRFARKTQTACEESAVRCSGQFLDNETRTANSVKGDFL